MSHCPFVCLCLQCHTAQLCVFVHNATCSVHPFFFVNNITVPICLSLYTMLQCPFVCLCSQCCMLFVFVHNVACSACLFVFVHNVPMPISLSLFTMSHCPNIRHSDFNALSLQIRFYQGEEREIHSGSPSDGSLPAILDHVCDAGYGCVGMSIMEALSIREASTDKH